MSGHRFNVYKFKSLAHLYRPRLKEKVSCITLSYNVMYKLWKCRKYGLTFYRDFRSDRKYMRRKTRMVNYCSSIFCTYNMIFVCFRQLLRGIYGISKEAKYLANFSRLFSSSDLIITLYETTDYKRSVQFLGHNYLAL